MLLFLLLLLLCVPQVCMRVVRGPGVSVLVAGSAQALASRNGGLGSTCKSVSFSGRQLGQVLRPELGRQVTGVCNLVDERLASGGSSLPELDGPRFLLAGAEAGQAESHVSFAVQLNPKVVSASELGVSVYSLSQGCSLPPLSFELTAVEEGRGHATRVDLWLSAGNRPEVVEVSLSVGGAGSDGGGATELSPWSVKVAFVPSAVADELSDAPLDLVSDLVYVVEAGCRVRPGSRLAQATLERLLEHAE